MALNRRAKRPECRSLRKPGALGASLRLDALELRSLLSTILVSSVADSGQGTLRQAVDQSIRGDTIVFTPNTAGQPVQLLSGPIRVRHDLTIQGLDPDQTIVSGSGSTRVFNVFGQGVDLTLVNLKIQDGVATPQTREELAFAGRRTLNDRISDARANDAGGLANALTRQAEAASLGAPVVTAAVAHTPSRATRPSDPLERAKAMGAGGLVNALTRSRGGAGSELPASVQAVNQTATQAAANPGQVGMGLPPDSATDSPARAAVPTRSGSQFALLPTATPSGASSLNASSRRITAAIDHAIESQTSGQARAASATIPRPGIAGTVGTARPRAGGTPVAQPSLADSGLGSAVAQAKRAARTQGYATPGSALGGAIYVSGGHLTIINSVLANNQAIGSGGGNAGQGGRGGDAIGPALYTLGSDFQAAGNTFRTVKVGGGNGGSGAGGGSGHVSASLGNSSLNVGNLVNVSPGPGSGTSAAPRTLAKNTGRTGGGNGGNGGQGGDALGGAVFSMGHRVTLLGNTFVNTHALGGNGGNGGGGGNGAVDVTLNGRSTVARYNVHGIRTGGGEGGEGGRGGNAFGGAVFNIGSRTTIGGNTFTDVSAVGGSGGNGGGGGGGAVDVVANDTNASIGGSGGLGLGGSLFNL